jgi:hypothetical protein
MDKLYAIHHLCTSPVDCAAFILPIGFLLFVVKNDVSAGA